MQYLSAIAMATILSTGILACSENNNEPSAPTDTKDTALQAAITAYIDNAVIPTYKTMADEAILLSDLCGQARDLFIAGDIDVEAPELHELPSKGQTALDIEFKKRQRASRSKRGHEVIPLRIELEAEEICLCAYRETSPEIHRVTEEDGTGIQIICRIYTIPQCSPPPFGIELYILALSRSGRK